MTIHFHSYHIGLFGLLGDEWLKPHILALVLFHHLLISVDELVKEFRLDLALSMVDFYEISWDQTGGISLRADVFL